MTALVVALLCAVLLLGALVIGLLRSHADILRALHSLGAGIGDPTAADADGSVGPVPITMGPSLPKERGSGAPDVLGTTPSGDAVAIATTSTELTLLAFLTSGCGTCHVFWKGLAEPQALPLPPGTRLVIVTKGAELESPDLVAGLAPRGVDIVLSTEAWKDYEVPAAPYFALVDGTAGVRVGEGLASSVEQLAGLIERVVHDGNHRARRQPARLDGPVHLDGIEREEDNDRALLASGIRPGDPSLYPPTPHGPPA
jgi:hypothetical protein